MKRRNPIRYDQDNDFYEVLGVPPWAAIDDLRRAFRQRAREVHPDRNPGRVEWATQQFRQLNEAYDVLSHAAKRDEYDRQRRWHHPEGAATGSRSALLEDDWWNRPHARNPAGAERTYEPRSGAYARRAGEPFRHWAAIVEGLLRGPYRYVLAVLALMLVVNAVFIAATQDQIGATSSRQPTSEPVTPGFYPVFDVLIPLARTTPLAPACTEGVNITAPRNGAEINFESFDIIGSAMHPLFESYTLTIEALDAPERSTPVPVRWVLRPMVRQPVVNGTLVAAASIRNVGEGNYLLRLTVRLVNGEELPPCAIVIRRKR
jgi:hypothetical protein